MNTKLPIDPAQALRVAVEATTSAGDLLLNLRRKPVGVLSEEAHDIKLQADREAEARILDILRRHMPLPVLTEESGEHDGAAEADVLWVVDPLDGTFNYSRGLPQCCTAVGLWAHGEPVVGAVYSFFTYELFTGVVGQGAWLNGRRIFASRVREKSEAALATGFPHQQDFSAGRLERFIRQIQDFKKIRMLGSAALMGAYVACGWVDVYTEADVWLWDVAAAAAICRAAGGLVRLRPGRAGTWAREVIFAATGELLQALEESP